MRPSFLRGLLIGFAAMLGGAFGAVVGLGAGPLVVDKAFGFHLGPEYRLILGAFGLVVWFPLSALGAAYVLDRDRPIRGTASAIFAALRRWREASVIRAADPVHARWKLRRSIWLAAGLWLLAAAAAMSAAYEQHIVVGEMLSYRIAWSTYQLDLEYPEMRALTIQQRRDYAHQFAQAMQGGSTSLFRLVVTSIVLTVAAAFTTISVVAASRRATLAEIRREFGRLQLVQESTGANAEFVPAGAIASVATDSVSF